MVKQTITFTDFNGVERTEDFYFNLTRAEILELNISVDGGLEEWAKSVADSRDGNAMMQMIKKIIAKSYGVKSPDGRRFIKNEEITNEFMETDAYSELLFKFMEDQKFVEEFFRAVPSVPASKNDRQNIVPMA